MGRLEGSGRSDVAIYRKNSALALTNIRLNGKILRAIEWLFFAILSGAAPFRMRFPPDAFEISDCSISGGAQLDSCMSPFYLHEPPFIGHLGTHPIPWEWAMTTYAE